MSRPTRSTRWAALCAGLAVTAAAGCSAADGTAGPPLAADDPLPVQVPADTVLRIGDPTTQRALELSGMAEELPFEVEWANITGGPQTLEAFRADALDVGSVADIPPLFAEWTGTDVTIITQQLRVDPVNHPTYELGIAPGVDVQSLEDLRGKEIAYSPGQAQGAVVLRVLEAAGLSQDDVELVEMASVEDVYVDALGSGQVEVAPLGGVLNRTYLTKYGSDGGTLLPHGLRDDPFGLYVPTEVLEDSHKAAALRSYVEYYALAQQWIRDHPQEWIQGYYVDQEGLTEADGAYLVEQTGELDLPADWTGLIDRHQATADLLSAEQGHPELDVADLYDLRFESVGADALAAGEGS